MSACVCGDLEDFGPILAGELERVPRAEAARDFSKNPFLEKI
jgi:hypothetical protein